MPMPSHIPMITAAVMRNGVSDVVGIDLKDLDTDMVTSSSRRIRRTWHRKKLIAEGLSLEDAPESSVFSVVGSKLFIVGTGPSLNETKFYDTVRRKWHKAPNLDTSASPFAVVVVSGRWLIAFPTRERLEEDERRRLFNLQVLDTETLDSWVHVPGIHPCMLPRTLGHAYAIDASALSNDTLYLNVEGIRGMSFKFSTPPYKGQWYFFKNELPFNDVAEFLPGDDLFAGYPRRETNHCLIGLYGRSLACGPLVEKAVFALDWIHRQPIEKDNTSVSYYGPCCLFPITTSLVLEARAVKVDIDNNHHCIEIKFLKLVQPAHEHHSHRLGKRPRKLFEDQLGPPKHHGKAQVISRSYVELGDRLLTTWLGI